MPATATEIIDTLASCVGIQAHPTVPLAQAAREGDSLARLALADWFDELGDADNGPVMAKTLRESLEPAKLKKGGFRLEYAAAPPEVVKIAQEFGPITVVKFFEARNYLKKIHHGYAIQTGKSVVIVEDDCTIGNKGLPAWGVYFVGYGTLESAVAGLYCHTAIQVGFPSPHRIPK